MKKMFLLLCVLTFCTNNYAQVGDTVRYSDPWYAFNPLPPLWYVGPVGGYNLNGLYSTWSPIINDEDTLPFRGREYQAFSYNNPDGKNYIYGIALTADTFIDANYNPIFTCMQGMSYRRVGPGGYIVVESIDREDSIWIQDEETLIKRCNFEYYLDYVEPDLTYTSSQTSNCFEFFFDNPVPIISDTFFIGGVTSPRIDRLQLPSDSIYGTCGVVYGGATAAPWLWIYEYDLFDHEIFGNAIYTYDGYNDPTASHQCSYMWGLIFPIVQLRCSTPQLQLVERGYRSATVVWKYHDTPELLQLSLGTYGSHPDTNMLVTVTATDSSYTFTDLEPETITEVWVRKACRYTTTGYDTLVWSEWSNPIIFRTLGIDEVEADGVRITSQRGSIVVEGAEGREVRVYDMLGREVTHSSVSVTADSSPILGEQRRIAVPTTGIYMVRVDNLPVRRVVVLR